METAKKLTNLQLELLKIFHYDLDEVQLKEVKLLLAQYFSKKASADMDKLWEENNWSADTMNEWLNEHN